MLKRLFCILLPLLVLCTLSCAHTPKDGELCYTLFDLDGAEAALLQIGDTNLLIDCGEKTSFFDLAVELDARGIQQIDYFILSHPHADHIGCASDVIKHYHPKYLLFPKLEANDDGFQAATDACTESGTTIKALLSGDTLQIEESLLEVFAPRGTVYPNANDHSLVLKITHKKTSLLLTADAEIYTEMELLASDFDLRADVLKVAHHGSQTSTCQEFVSAVSAKYALISTPNDDHSFQPSVLVIEQLKKYASEIFCTHERGNITVISDGENITISTEK